MSLNVAVQGMHTQYIRVFIDSHRVFKSSKERLLSEVTGQCWDYPEPDKQTPILIYLGGLNSAKRYRTRGAFKVHSLKHSIPKLQCLVEYKQRALQ